MASNTSTGRPCRDSTSAAISPAGPAPTTATGNGLASEPFAIASIAGIPDTPTWFLSQFPHCNGIANSAKEQQNMASDLIKHVSDATFETDVLKSGKPVLVDYWAEWCGPCKMIAPILDEVSTAYQDKLQIAKMNVDENREVPAKFGIRGIPTLMLFKDGQLAATKVGAMSKAQLTAFIDQQLA